MDKNHKERTHFGYERVERKDKSERVQGLFGEVAPGYDLLNDILSFGLHRLWKRIAIEHSGVQQGYSVLDIASGTGDLALLLSRVVGETGRVVMLDPTLEMLRRGRNRLLEQGCVCPLVCAQGEQLPFGTGSFDAITLGFGLRNFTDKAQGLAEALRCLKPGGRLLVLEFSHPVSANLGQVYDAYSFEVMPRLGRWLQDNEEAYRYLAESIRMHPDQEQLLAMFTDAGFAHCDYRNINGGIVALHWGVKP